MGSHQTRMKHRLHAAFMDLLARGANAARRGRSVAAGPKLHRAATMGRAATTPISAEALGAADSVRDKTLDNCSGMSRGACGQALKGVVCFTRRGT